MSYPYPVYKTKFCYFLSDKNCKPFPHLSINGTPSHLSLRTFSKAVTNVGVTDPEIKSKVLSSSQIFLLNDLMVMY